MWEATSVNRIKEEIVPIGSIPFSLLLITDTGWQATTYFHHHTFPTVMAYTLQLNPRKNTSFLKLFFLVCTQTNACPLLIIQHYFNHFVPSDATALPMFFHFLTKALPLLVCEHWLTAQASRVFKQH